MNNVNRTLLCLGLTISCSIVQAHVTLPPGGAAAGSSYAAAFRVGHACTGSSSTTGVRVRLPDGFAFLGAEARPGWTLTQTDHEVAWKAATPQAALPGAERASFVVRGRLTERPGTLWFKVLQTCDQGTADWADVSGNKSPGANLPAARLEVLPPGIAAVDVQDAWARPTVAGQGSAGVYARLTAPSGARLMSVSTPAAETAGVHEMRMDGNVMHMQELEAGLDLPPGKPVDLGPGGFHIMLTKIKQPIDLGTSFPMTLKFVDREGRKGSLEVQVQVKQGPAPAPSEHQH